LRRSKLEQEREFIGIRYPNEDFSQRRLGHIEQTVNEWLKKERISRLLCVTHTNNEAMIFIPVWWS
jgi:hypothetical protein